MTVSLVNKPANRLPEAYWVSFIPSEVVSVFAEKMGDRVDVLDVVKGGNRQMHGIDSYVDIVTNKGYFRITSLDAPVVAIGERNALNYSTGLPDISKGIHFCLFNNLWGTNFTMWWEGSIAYRFKIQYHTKDAASLPVQQPVIEARLLPAVYKSKNGLTQKVEATVNHAGKPATVTLTLGGRSWKEKLETGKNLFLLEIPQVTVPQQMELTLANGKEKASIPVDVAPPRQWTMNFVQHSHTDIGYTRSQTEILAEHLRYIDYALDYCDATDHYPEEAHFRWTCEISWAVSEYLKSRPAEQIARLKKRVEEGRIELAAMYLNFDELPDEQTLAASLYPLKQFRDAGLKSELAMQNDVNGIGWCFSEYFADLGVKYVNMGTHGHRALIAFDYPTVFWWQSPSGKKILTYRAEHYMQGNFFGVESDNFARFEERLLNYLETLGNKGYPYDIAVAQHSGYSTDNSPPSTNSSEMIRRWNEKYEWPKLRSSVASEFFKEVESRYAGKIQTIRGAWPDWWTDGFASGAREAAISRITHSDIIAYQTALSLAKIQGAALPRDVNSQFDHINRALLFYDEHTFGHSESVRNPYGRETWEQRSLKQSYAWEAYRRSGLLGEVAMGVLQTYIPKTATPSIVVFNPLNWRYSGIVNAYIDHQIIPRDRKFEIVDAAGKVLPAQAGERRSDGTYWSVYVENVPPLGYAQYTIHVKGAPADKPETHPLWKQNRTENDWYIIDFNLRKGTISGWYDKELGKQLITPGAEWELGEFIYEIIDSRHPMELYRAPQFIRRPPEKMRFVRYEKGAIWDSFRFVGETVAGREPDNLAVEFRIHSTSKKIEIIYNLRKKAVTDPEAVYIAFPFEVENGKIHLDVPGGTIEAGVDQIRGSSNDWYTVQNFATAMGGKEQVIVCSPEIPLMQFGAINTGRYKAGAVPQSAHMYSWPMNNYWVTNFNADQMGELQWRYLLHSAATNTTEYATRFAWENRIPLPTRVLPAGGGQKAPAEPVSLLELTPANLLLITMKPVEGENAVLLQLRETGGKPATLEVVSSRIKAGKLTVCDALGDPLPGNPAPDFKPWENKFIKWSW
ncbi:MAG: glycosyl hydrolase family 38 [Tannerellaceae bacterium]|nr:glycosyl hydrolase family 38 [Tannerellaceae bacterium]